MSLLVSSGGGGPITASDITDSSASGITVLTGTPAQALEAIGADAFAVPHASTYTEGFKTGGASSGLQVGRILLQTGATVGGGVAALANYATELVSIGSRETQRNLDASGVVSFMLCVVTTGAGGVFRAGFGKVAADAMGDWAKAGYGVSLNNTALAGWYYDTSLKSVDLSTAVAMNSAYHVSIERTPTHLIWYVDGVERARAAVNTIGYAAVNSAWRYEATNGATTTILRVALSGVVERIRSSTYVAGLEPADLDVNGLTSVEVGGYLTKTIVGARTFSATRPSATNASARWYLVPNGDQSAVATMEAIAGIKLFANDFVADQANYDDFGIYNAPYGLMFNSKRLGTGAVKSFFFCDQDTTPFVKVDVVTREVELMLAGKGIVMKSPDGTRYRIAVANGGALSATAV